MRAFLDKSRCRPGVVLLLVSYSVTAVGIPLPAANSAKETRGLFPCASSGCGCDSAERCWRSCCCHTLAQRLTWARANGVQPPAFAVAAARQAGLDQLLLTSTPPAAPKSCCTEKESHVNFAASPKRIVTLVVADDDSQPTERESTHLFGWRALGCRGQSLNWLAAVPALVIVPSELVATVPCIAWLGRIPSEHAGHTSTSPFVPPPELA